MRYRKMDLNKAKRNGWANREVTPDTMLRNLMLTGMDNATAREMVAKHFPAWGKDSSPVQK